MSESYKEFSEIYDTLTFDVDYNEYIKFLNKIFKKNKFKPELVLDLACGTGTMTKLLSEQGFDVIGIDYSADMLDVAKKKCEGLDILFLNQDMTSFELYGTVDVIVCALDSLNYITNKNDIKKIFKLAHNYLNYDGLFIFDINTPYKFKNVLGNNTFVYEHENIFYTWENETKKDITQFYLNFFVKNESGVYERFEEVHIQRAYTKEFIINELQKSGLKIQELCSDFKFKKPDEKSDRYFFVAKKERN